MNLSQAIQTIISDYGADILKERRFVGLLLDYQAFEQMPYAANMLRQIYANGYGTKIYTLYLSKEQTETAAFLSELRNKLGFDVEMLSKVLVEFSLPITTKKSKALIKPYNADTNSIDLRIGKWCKKTVLKDEFDGIYSYPDAETFIKLNNTQRISYTIKEGTKFIADFAFKECTSLRQITIPNSVTIIENGAFQGCSRLQDITIPNSVTVIENGAFKSCSTLNQITLSNSVNTIKESVFANCTSLHQITIPDSVTTIEKCAFDSCKSLEQITIPNSVSAFGERAFWNCLSLNQIEISNSTTQIGEKAFWNCPGDKWSPEKSELIESKKKEKEKQLKNEQRQMINVILTIIAIILNILTYFVSGWWLILTLFITLCGCIAIFDAKDDSITRSYIGYVVMILIFISIFTPIPWWFMLIELIAMGCLIGGVVNDFAYRTF